MPSPATPKPINSKTKPSRTRAKTEALRMVMIKAVVPLETTAITGTSPTRPKTAITIRNRAKMRSSSAMEADLRQPRDRVRVRGKPRVVEARGTKTKEGVTRLVKEANVTTISDKTKIRSEEAKTREGLRLRMPQLLPQVAMRRPKEMAASSNKYNMSKSSPSSRKRASNSMWPSRKRRVARTKAPARRGTRARIKKDNSRCSTRRNRIKQTKKSNKSKFSSLKISHKQQQQLQLQLHQAHRSKARQGQQLRPLLSKFCALMSQRCEVFQLSIPLSPK
mmetsp:Transcript_13840/g.17545  ORF Transcript_13840/g.17545 Transcript_13840/m.17545 type:complete len:278 (+) Transcript_13840:190-1023(+)